MEQSVDVAGALLWLVHLGNAARIVGGFCSHESAYLATHAAPARLPLVTRSRRKASLYDRPAGLRSDRADPARPRALLPFQLARVFCTATGSWILGRISNPAEPPRAQRVARPRPTGFRRRPGA